MARRPVSGAGRHFLSLLSFMAANGPVASDRALDRVGLDHLERSERRRFSPTAA